MKTLKALMILVFLFALPVHSKTINITLLGLIDAPNEEEFNKAALYFSIASLKNKEKTIVAAPWKLNFIDGLKSIEYNKLQNKKDLKKILKKVGEGLSGEDTVNFFIYGHGFAAKSELKPETSGIVLSEGKLRHKEFENLVWEYIPFGANVKVIAPYCFSGGIHELSMSRPNTCSAAATDFRTPSTGENDIFGTSNTYASKITYMLYSQPKESLENLHLITAESDFWNDRNGRLSSMDYLRRLFKTPPYKKTQGFIDRLFSDYPLKTNLYNPIEKHCEGLDKNAMLEKEKVTSLIEQTREIVKKIDEEGVFTNKKVPEFVKNRYKNIIKRYSDNFDSYLKLYTKKQNDYQFFKNELLDENGNFKTAVDYYHQMTFYDIEREARLTFSQLLYFYRLKEDVKLIEDLYDKGDVYDIHKFERLVKCEQK